MPLTISRNANHMHAARGMLEALHHTTPDCDDPHIKHEIPPPETYAVSFFVLVQLQFWRCSNHFSSKTVAVSDPGGTFFHVLQFPLCEIRPKAVDAQIT